MKILDIENRTENWRTAYYFSPFFRDEDARLRLAKELLARHLGTQPAALHAEAKSVRINLFWYGIRDCLNKLNATLDDRVRDLDTIQHFADRYKVLFRDLRERIDGFQRLRTSHPHNYNPFVGVNKGNLANNLVNTEVDIVLETPNHLFIGEAKHETGFDNFDTRYVLVHQLIRQFVTARILLDLLGCEKRIVQFVVANDSDAAKNFGQIKFVLSQCWMSGRNILTWEDIKELWPKN